MVFWIQKGAYLLIVFHRLKGMCKNPLFIFALIFIKKLFWFCIRFFLITIIFSPHVLIAILTRAFSLICTISCCTNLYYLLSTGVYLRWLLCFWPTLFFRHLQRELQCSLPFFIISYHHIEKKNSSRGGGERCPRGIAIKVEKGMERLLPLPRTESLISLKAVR